MRLLDALLKAVEKAGHLVRPPEVYSKPAHLLVGGLEVRFTLRERLSRSPHVATEEERRHAFHIPAWDMRPAGQLRLRIECGHPDPQDAAWSDSPKRPLESQLDDVLLCILNVPPRVRAQQAQREVRARLWAEEARRRREAEEARRDEERRAEALLSEAAKWQHAALLRRYVAALREEARRRGADTSDEAPAGRWLRWAAEVAERMDPLEARLGTVMPPQPPSFEGGQPTGGAPRGLPVTLTASPGERPRPEALPRPAQESDEADEGGGAPC